MFYYKFSLLSLYAWLKINEGKIDKEEHFSFIDLSVTRVDKLRNLLPYTETERKILNECLLYLKKSLYYLN